LKTLPDSANVDALIRWFLTAALKGKENKQTPEAAQAYLQTILYGSFNKTSCQNKRRRR
jgi:hypothetical protein